MAVKEKAPVTIDSNLRERIEKIGEQNGLNFSDRVERAVRYYLFELEEEIKENSEAYKAYIDPDNRGRITLSELKATYKPES